LEHIFSLFATVLPREIKIAFRALHTDDKMLRGVAISIWMGAAGSSGRSVGMIETKPLVQVPEGHRDPLGELLRSHESLLLALARDVQHRNTDGQEC
jgi:hypothetical protein